MKLMREGQSGGVAYGGGRVEELLGWNGGVEELTVVVRAVVAAKWRS